MAGLFIAMPQTLLEIANSALIKVGERTITSLSQTIKPAELCNARIKPLRNKMIRSHLWTFFKKVATLNSEATSVNGWAHQMSLPTDLGRVWALCDESNTYYLDGYELVGGKLFAQLESVVLRYTYIPADSVDATLQYQDDFAEALACLLASEIAVPLMEAQGLRDQYYRQYMEELRQARFNGAVEQSVQRIQASDWLDSRTGATVDRGALGLDAPAGGI